MKLTSKNYAVPLAIVALFTQSIFAQAPNKMNYQAVIRDASNALIVNQAVGMSISILQGSSSGTAVYSEVHTPTTNSNGLISIEIGDGLAVTGQFSTINWANGPYFLKTETDPTGGTSYSITGTSQLLSVPYALYAASSGSSLPGPQGPAGPQGPVGPQGPACFTHRIGELFGGGVIFHLWKDSLGAEHGLIIDLIDLCTACEWSNIQFDLVGIAAQSYWDGLTNSQAIVLQAGHDSSAASLCLNSTNGGYSDWYLPSFQELRLLNKNGYEISRTLSGINGASQLDLVSNPYWSSTEIQEDYAVLVGADGFTYYTALKLSTGAVRAIRAF